jgi:hypothetical protein
VLEQEPGPQWGQNRKELVSEQGWELRKLEREQSKLGLAPYRWVAERKLGAPGKLGPVRKLGAPGKLEPECKPGELDKREPEECRPGAPGKLEPELCRMACRQEPGCRMVRRLEPCMTELENMERN